MKSKKIYVFKTSVKYKRQITIISKHINQITGVLEWNFDLEDCDNILRIVASHDIVKVVEEKLNSLDYICEELL